MPIYTLIFFIYLKFRPIRKAISDTNDFFNNMSDSEDTPSKGVEQQKRRDALKDAITKGKAYLLGGKKPWTFEPIDSMNDETKQDIL